MMSNHKRRHSRFCIAGAALLSAFTFSPFVHAGGTAENVLLIIDPTRPDAQYLGNYYKNVRNIPAANILYMDPGATDYPTFVSDNLDAVFGTLANAGVGDHVDFIILAPSDSYFINAPGLINDSCSPVNRFAISAAYMTAYISDQILNGRNVTMPNRYFRAAGARYFSNATSYFDGLPSGDVRARRYFLGATLGYTGLRGNTPDELIAMIDRSVAVDGTHPSGTFYFMETTDANRSGPRDGLFDATVTKIINAGGNAEHLTDVLPLQRHDCLGIMTGWASPDIDNGDFTILPGAYCDHLTSFAGTFATSAQVKLSRWIVKGASGSYGTVEEPCNYPGKFPTARIHQFYFKGLSLGEAVFRNLEFVAFQGLIYGDPLTRPFAYPPDVQVAGAPAGTVSGTVQFTPSATSSNPNGVSFTGFDLHVDGRVLDSIADGDSFSLDTTRLPDGWHDLRVLTFENTNVHSAGRWTADFVSDNRGRSATLAVSPGSGDWNTAFTADLAAFGAGAAEVRLLQNGRVVAAAGGASASLVVHGLTLGAGPAVVQTEALYADGERVLSPPFTIDVAFGGAAPIDAAPVAFDYTKRILPDSSAVVELPATFDDGVIPLSYQIVSGPAQATIVTGHDGPWRLVRPASGASGTDQFTFRVDSAAGSSNVATVTLEYITCQGDIDGDNVVGLGDLAVLLANFGTTSGATLADGDLDGDGDVDLADLAQMLANFGTTCV